MRADRHNVLTALAIYETNGYELVDRWIEENAKRLRKTNTEVLKFRLRFSVGAYNNCPCGSMSVVVDCCGEW